MLFFPSSSSEEILWMIYANFFYNSRFSERINLPDAWLRNILKKMQWCLDSTQCRLKSLEDFEKRKLSQKVKIFNQYWMMLSELILSLHPRINFWFFQELLWERVLLPPFFNFMCTSLSCLLTKRKKSCIFSSKTCNVWQGM